MQIAVTFRHMESSDALRSYVEEKLARVKKYIEEPIDAPGSFVGAEKNKSSSRGGHGCQRVDHEEYRE